MIRITTFALALLCSQCIRVVAQRDSQFDADFQKLFQGGALDLQAEDETQSEFFPWSYKPVCTEKLEIIEDILCIYTNKSFSNGRGISIFTTPKIAEEFATLAPFHDDNVLKDNDINAFTSTWTTASLPGKGVGMLASRPIALGETITAYTPLLLAYTESVVPPLERERLLKIGLNQLPVPSLNMYTSLARVFHKPAFSTSDVIAANAFEISVGNQMHLAVFPESSRFNHDCGPNAQYTLNASVLTHRVRAARDIAAGEELTIAYWNVLAPYAERQAHLEKSFRFQCECARCLAGEADDDDLLEEIARLQASLGNWEPYSKGSVKQAERLVKLYRDAGLHAFLDQAYGHAALAYNAAGSARGAQKYAKLAKEALELRLGKDAEDMKHWDKILNEPQRHWSWRRRKLASNGKSEL